MNIFNNRGPGHRLFAHMLLFGLLCFFASPAAGLAGEAKYLFKIASLAPDGSIWAKRFRDFTEEVRRRSNGEIGFKIYAGGVMGDDRAMYRKMRIGQLQGGGFTMNGIGTVVPDFRVMGIPFFLDSYAEVDRVRKGLWPRFREAFAEKGLELLAMSEVGFIYTMSTRPITTLEELRRSKSWGPDDDPISLKFLEVVGVTPIPLAIPDVLTSLQTGLIDTTFNSYYGSIVLQWFTAIQYMTDIPFAYAYGAFVLDARSFNRLPDEYARMMREAAADHFSTLLADTRRSNRESLEVLLQKGIKPVHPTPATLTALEKARETTVNSLIDRSFSREIYQEANRILSGFRRSEQDREQRP